RCDSAYGRGFSASEETRLAWSAARCGPLARKTRHAGRRIHPIRNESLSPVAWSRRPALRVFDESNLGNARVIPITIQGGREVSAEMKATPTHHAMRPMSSAFEIRETKRSPL